MPANRRAGDRQVGRRRFPRVSTYKHARIETEAETPVSVSCIVFEIGAQGCGIRSEEDLDVGSSVRISLYDNSRLDPVVFRARVVWCGKIDGSNLKSYGIQFLKFDAGHHSAGEQEVEAVLSDVGSRLQLDEDE